MYSKFEKLCVSKGITPYRVAKDLGFSRSFFSDWKTGRSKPKNDKIKKIADYFGVNTAYFYDEKEENQAYYLDSETKEIAQTIFENKDLRLLFDSAKNASSEDLQTVYTMLKALKSKEGGNIE